METESLVLLACSAMMVLTIYAGTIFLAKQHGLPENGDWTNSRIVIPRIIAGIVAFWALLALPTMFGGPIFVTTVWLLMLWQPSKKQVSS